jgi:hypothetical protein
MIVCSAILALITAQAAGPSADLEVIPLPSLQIDGQAARAHTQGLEVVGAQYYVTARLETVLPKRAILLRTEPQGTRWDSWDITPANPEGASTHLDHPGGMQSDGKRLWIPVAQSVRHGRSVIRVFALERLMPGRQAAPELDFDVADHIGAVGVMTNQQLVFGASWDTETIYVWNFEGRLQRTLTGPELISRNLGAVPGQGGHAGVAVQDWKAVGDRLFASGLFRDPAAATVSPRSRLLVFARFLDPVFECQMISLPIRESTELGREAMAISAGFVHFLPEDLGASNRLFRAPLANLLNRGMPANVGVREE